MQAQAEPHGADGAAPGDAAPTEANTDNSRTASSWPSGHDVGVSDCDMGRLTSKVVSQVRHRYSYSGT